MRPLGLAQDDPERARHLGVFRPGQQQLCAADDHGQRIVQLVAGSGGELAERIQFPPTQPLLVALDPAADRGDDRLEPTLQLRAFGEQRGPRAQARRACRSASPATIPGASPGHQSSATARSGPRACERDHDARRMRIIPAGRRVGPTLLEPRDPGGADAGLGAPGPRRAVGPFLGGLARRRAGQEVEEPVGAVAAGPQPAELEPQPGVLARRLLLVRRGGRVDERGAAARLDLGHQDPQPRLVGHRLAVRGEQRPGGLLGPLMGLPDDRQAVRGHRGATQGPVPIRVQPGGVNDQRIAPPALGQPTSQVVQVGAQVGPLHPLAHDGVILPPPGDQPFRVDRRDRPPSQAAELARPRDGLGIRVAGLARQPTRHDPDRDGMTPEAVEQLRDGSRRGARRPPGPLGDRRQSVRGPPIPRDGEHPAGVELAAGVRLEGAEVLRIVIGGRSGRAPRNVRAVTGRSGSPSRRRSRRLRSSAVLRWVRTRNALGLLPARVRGHRHSEVDLARPAQRRRNRSFRIADSEFRITDSERAARPAIPGFANPESGIRNLRFARRSDSLAGLQPMPGTLASISKSRQTRRISSSISSGLCRKSSAPDVAQLLDLVLLDHPRDADDLDVRHGRDRAGSARRPPGR